MHNRSDPVAGPGVPAPHWHRWRIRGLAALVLAGLSWAAFAADRPQTVCTITINSADEKQAFARHLPASKYNFVELVERQRPDWLASACHAGVRCDVLIISGHYDGHNVFFSDQLDEREFLPVDELERVSCSGSCEGLFSQLKEVHLYGCNTLDADANSSGSPEVLRSLLRQGHTLKDAERQLRTLNASHGESSRDRMRQIFKDVPVIYGFSSVAPLGPLAATTLNGYFRSGGVKDVGSGRPSKRLLSQFSPFAMASTPGIIASDPQFPVREDVCRFADDRLTDAARLTFVHQMLQRGSEQARVHLDRIQRHATALVDPARRTPEVNQAFEAIGNDTAARGRFLDFARDADQPAVRARMFQLAQDLGWLTPEQRTNELAQMLGDLQARPTVGLVEVDLACSLNPNHELDDAYYWRPLDAAEADNLSKAAVRACLGSKAAQTRTLDALVSETEAEVKIAQAYLRHRPISDITELRRRAQRIASMRSAPAQVRALEALGRHYVSDREILEQLVALFSATSSSAIQTAVAGILIRADLRLIASPQLVTTLQRQRRSSPPGDDVIDALIRRLQDS